MNHFLTFDEARQLIGCSVSTLRQMIAAKEIRTFKFHEPLLHTGDCVKAAQRIQKLKASLKAGPKPKRTVAAKPSTKTRKVKFEGLSMVGPDQPFEPVRMKR